VNGKILYEGWITDCIIIAMMGGGGGGEEYDRMRLRDSRAG